MVWIFGYKKACFAFLVICMWIESSMASNSVDFYYGSYEMKWVESGIGPITQIFDLSDIAHLLMKQSWT